MCDVLCASGAERALVSTNGLHAADLGIRPNGPNADRRFGEADGLGAAQEDPRSFAERRVHDVCEEAVPLMGVVGRHRVASAQPEGPFTIAHALRRVEHGAGGFHFVRAGAWCFERASLWCAALAAPCGVRRRNRSISARVSAWAAGKGRPSVRGPWRVEGRARRGGIGARPKRHQ